MGSFKSPVPSSSCVSLSERLHREEQQAAEEAEQRLEQEEEQVEQEEEEEQDRIAKFKAAAETQAGDPVRLVLLWCRLMMFFLHMYFFLAIAKLIYFLLCQSQ